MNSNDDRDNDKVRMVATIMAVIMITVALLG